MTCFAAPNPSHPRAGPAAGARTGKGRGPGGPQPAGDVGHPAVARGTPDPSTRPVRRRECVGCPPTRAPTKSCRPPAGRRAPASRSLQSAAANDRRFRWPVPSAAWCRASPPRRRRPAPPAPVPVPSWIWPCSCPCPGSRRVVHNGVAAFGIGIRRVRERLRRRRLRPRCADGRCCTSDWKWGCFPRSRAGKIGFPVISMSWRQVEEIRLSRDTYSLS